MNEIFRVCNVNGLRIVVFTADRGQTVVRIADSDEDFKEVWLTRSKAKLLAKAFVEASQTD